jgi:hypothetical protein
MQLRHICEVCGREEVLTPEAAYGLGWDYSPRMGSWGVISPRICPNCLINRTAWWAMAPAYPVAPVVPKTRPPAPPAPASPSSAVPPPVLPPVPPAPPSPASRAAPPLPPSPPIGASVIERGRAVIDAMIALSNITRTVSPTEEGGVTFFWPEAENQLSIEVEPTGALYVHTTDLSAGTFTDGKIPADVDDLADALDSWLAEAAANE